MPVTINGSGATGSINSAVLPSSGTFATVPGAWTAWTPTVTVGSGSLTTSTVERARYIQFGKTVSLFIDFSIANAGTAAGVLQFTIPVAAANVYSASGSVIDFGKDLISGTCYLQTTGRIDCYRYDGATIILTNRRYAISITYEAA